MLKLSSSQPMIIQHFISILNLVAFYRKLTKGLIHVNKMKIKRYAKNENLFSHILCVDVLFSALPAYLGGYIGDILDNIYFVSWHSRCCPKCCLYQLLIYLLISTWLLGNMNGGFKTAWWICPSTAKGKPELSLNQHPDMHYFWSCCHFIDKHIPLLWLKLMPLRRLDFKRNHLLVYQIEILEIKIKPRLPFFHRITCEPNLVQIFVIILWEPI